MDEMPDAINAEEVMPGGDEGYMPNEYTGLPTSETPTAVTTAEGDEKDIGFLGEVEVTATVELGRTQMPVREVLKLRRGSVVELDKLVGQPADLLINSTPMAKGEVIVINERFGFRITKFYSASDK